MGVEGVGVELSVGGLDGPGHESRWPNTASFFIFRLQIGHATMSSEGSELGLTLGCALDGLARCTSSLPAWPGLLLSTASTAGAALLSGPRL